MVKIRKLLILGLFFDNVFKINVSQMSSFNSMFLGVIHWLKYLFLLNLWPKHCLLPYLELQLVFKLVTPDSTHAGEFCNDLISEIKV